MTLMYAKILFVAVAERKTLRKMINIQAAIYKIHSN